MESTGHEERTEHQDTLLDVIARLVHGLGTWLSHTSRRTGAWVRKRGRVVWVERDILKLREQRTDAMVALGESVYRTFRDQAAGRPELMAQVDQIQELDLTLARKKRLKDRIEREGGI